jgi:glycerol-3-phosphate responsive antiterminator
MIRIDHPRPSEIKHVKSKEKRTIFDVDSIAGVHCNRVGIDIVASSSPLNRTLRKA